jgi:hypothetical protein
LFNLAIDSKLRGCDLVRLQVDDVCAGGRVRDRATIVQKKTGRPVQFEITEQTRASIQDRLSKVDARTRRYLFLSRFRAGDYYRATFEAEQDRQGRRHTALCPAPSADAALPSSACRPFPRCPKRTASVELVDGDAATPGLANTSAVSTATTFACRRLCLGSYREGPRVCRLTGGGK